MSLFRRKKPVLRYDAATQQPAVRQSICTGEMTAGFIDRQTGRFREVMRVDGRRGLEAFAREAGVAPEDVRIIY